MNQGFAKELKLSKIARNVCAGIFLAIFLLVLLFSGSIEYACKHGFTAQSQGFFLAVGLAIVAALFFVAFLLRGRAERVKGLMANDKSFAVISLVAVIVLFALQLFIVHSAWFETGWDVSTITNIGDPQGLAPYLSQYPNQIFLYGGFRAIAKLGSLIGIQSAYLSLVLGSCACVSLSILLVSFAARGIFGYSVGYLTLFVSFFFVGLSPWILVPYSDTYGMLCPSLVLFCYVVLRGRKTKWALISFFSLIGYYIKPTAIFVLAAIIAVEVCSFLVHRKGESGIADADKRSKKDFLQSLLLFGLGLVLAFGVSTAVKALSPALDSDRAFSMSHFLMMGANAQTKGVYSEDDVLASRNCPDEASRKSMNLREWQYRLAEMGPTGLAELSAEKTLCNFADGTFAWADEGRFWMVLHGDGQVVCGFYGIGSFSSAADGSSSAKAFQCTTQIVWLMVLLGLVLGLARKNVKKGELAVYLALVALAVFLMIFECRARYLFLYMPYFVMLGVAGWAGLYDRLALLVEPAGNR